MNSDQSPIRLAVARREVLAKCPEIRRFDSADHDEADAIAHAFMDIEGSLEILRRDIFSRLLAEDLTPDQIYDLVQSAREELRHILYHIGDCKTFRVLLDP